MGPVFVGCFLPMGVIVEEESDPAFCLQPLSFKCGIYFFFSANLEVVGGTVIVLPVGAGLGFGSGMFERLGAAVAGVGVTHEPHFFEAVEEDLGRGDVLPEGWEGGLGGGGVEVKGDGLNSQLHSG